MNSLERLYWAVVKRWWGVVCPIYLRSKGVTVGRRVKFYGWPIVSIARGSKIVIGDDVTLCSISQFTALGVCHPVILRTLRQGALISVGSSSGLSGTTICAAQSVEIGRDCLVGADAKIVDTDFHALNPVGRRSNNDWKQIGVAPVKIGDNVFLGAGVMVLKGVEIGSNSVVGACAVVSKRIPEGALAAGNPASVLRRLADAC